MSNFIYDIKIGILAFPLVALILALPYALYQYRRFGAISIWKTFVVFTFILYCMCAGALIVFPMPADHSAVVEAAQHPQLHPLAFIDQIRQSTPFSLHDRSTWLTSLKSPVAYEAVFNVVLTLPLGAYLCYLFRCRWWLALLIGFATTLCFEVSQLTGLFGLYEHPYRLFDVDDIILNTAGCMLGFWLMIPLAWMLPSIDDVNERSMAKGERRVTLTRRFVAMIVDVIVWIALFALAWAVLSPADALPMGFAVVAVICACATAVTKYRTVGKAMVGIPKEVSEEMPAAGNKSLFTPVPPAPDATQLVENSGKQAALDSLMQNAEYIEPEPWDAAQDQTQVMDAPANLPTRQIRTPQGASTLPVGKNDQRKIKRDLRPDAGGTKEFKRR